MLISVLVIILILLNWKYKIRWRKSVIAVSSRKGGYAPPFRGLGGGTAPLASPLYTPLVGSVNKSF